MVNFENGVTPINDTNLNKMQTDLLKAVFPIGSTYITQENTNPSTILGFGTWERFKGLIALGVDEDDTDLSTIGKTGGEKKHKLTINEMPSHSHSYTNGQRPLFWDANMSPLGGLGTGDGVQSDWNLSTNDEGGNQPHNNMQPYEVVGYMWIRRA